MKGTAGFRAISRALAHRNFGIYIAGNSVSLIGTWMQRIGVGWLAWELSHRAPCSASWRSQISFPAC
jgi:hypothetical protein